MAPEKGLRAPRAARGRDARTVGCERPRVRGLRHGDEQDTAWSDRQYGPAHYACPTSAIADLHARMTVSVQWRQCRLA